LIESFFCFLFCISLTYSYFGFAEDTFVRKSKRKTSFPFVFLSLIRIFASDIKKERLKSELKT